MRYVFQNEDRVYFVTRFVRGGDLFTHFERAGGSFEESRARFYATQIIMAFGYLHEKNIVHRDLKLENILMDEDGYVCLTDFGISKVLEKGELSKTHVGTKDYTAPEIIERTGHAFEVDWWTLGILTYDMIVGAPPFTGI